MKTFVAVLMAVGLSGCMVGEPVESGEEPGVEEEMDPATETCKQQCDAAYEACCSMCRRTRGGASCYASCMEDYSSCLRACTRWRDF